MSKNFLFAKNLRYPKTAIQKKPKFVVAFRNCYEECLKKIKDEPTLMQNVLEIENTAKQSWKFASKTDKISLVITNRIDLINLCGIQRKDIKKYKLEIELIKRCLCIAAKYAENQIEEKKFQIDAITNKYIEKKKFQIDASDKSIKEKKTNKVIKQKSEIDNSQLTKSDTSMKEEKIKNTHKNKKKSKHGIKSKSITKIYSAVSRFVEQSKLSQICNVEHVKEIIREISEFADGPVEIVKCKNCCQKLITTNEDIKAADDARKKQESTYKMVISQSIDVIGYFFIGGKRCFCLDCVKSIGLIRCRCFCPKICLKNDQCKKCCGNNVRGRNQISGLRIRNQSYYTKCNLSRS
eukprot:406937_1